MSKLCRDCGEQKDLEEFPPNKKSRDGRGSYCRLCMRVRHRSYRDKQLGHAPSRRTRARATSAAVKWCPDCRQELPRSEFGSNKGNSDGLTGYCRPCHNARSKAAHVRRHGSTRNYHLIRRYGITAAEYDERKAAQDGLCALCREREAEHVDHDHKTGEIRGLLCSCCNQGLGNFRDDARFLRAAADYVERKQRWRCVQRGVYRLVLPRAA